MERKKPYKPNYKKTNYQTMTIFSRKFKKRSKSVEKKKHSNDILNNEKLNKVQLL